MMQERLKERLVGAAVLVSLAVIFLPMVLEQAPDLEAPDLGSAIPRRPNVEEVARALPVANERTLPAPVSPPKRRTEPVAAVREPVESRPISPAWVVQLASFSNADNALALRDRLRKKGYTVFIEKVGAAGKKTTRVFVGPELRRQVSVEVQKRLLRDTELKGLVVRYPSDS